MKRVIQFATGNVGKHALPMIIERPDLQLVGLHAHGPDKVGCDAAAVCGLSEPTGVIATNDIDALVELGADCVVYTSQAEMRPQQAIEEICRFLRAGTNVVGTSMVWLVAPHHADAWIREPLAQACADGGTSLYINGVSFGFGTTPDHTPIMFAPGVLSSLWGGQVRSLAEVLGVTLDEVRERRESWVTPEPIDCTMMSVAPGQVAAVRFAVEGIRNGQPVITMEHVNRLTPVTAPHWPYPPDGRLGVHRVVVHGSPGVEVNTHLGLDGVDHNDGGVISTAARAVNAIDAVCAAPPGLLSVKDLPTAHADGVMWTRRAGGTARPKARGRAKRPGNGTA